MFTICPRTSVQPRWQRSPLPSRAYTPVSDVSELDRLPSSSGESLTRARLALKEVHSPPHKHSHTARALLKAQAPLPSVGSFITYRWTANIYTCGPSLLAGSKNIWATTPRSREGTALPEESSHYAGEYFRPEEECSLRVAEYLCPEEECLRRVEECFAPCASSDILPPLSLRCSFVRLPDKDQ